MGVFTMDDFIITPNEWPWGNFHLSRKIINPAQKPWGYPPPDYSYDPVIQLGVPIPTVSADTSVIAEDPVSTGAIELSVPIPTVTADTSVLAEDPVSTGAIELSVPIPTVSVDTDVNENPE